MRRPFLLSVLAAVLVLAGCGGADEAATPAAPAASAPAPSATPTEDPSGPAEDPPGQTYLALGDSLAAGYQPGGTELRDSAYPALALSRLDRAGAELTLENLACSGETTTSFLEGGKCDYAEGSQMAQAEAVLAERAGDVALVTIDLGGNDLLRCVRETSVDTACTKTGLAGVADNLPEILDRLRAAAGQDVPVLVLGYYNPWLAASYLGEGEGQLDAATSAYTALDRRDHQGRDRGRCDPGAADVGLQARRRDPDDVRRPRGPDQRGPGVHPHLHLHGVRHPPHRRGRGRGRPGAGRRRHEGRRGLTRAQSARVGCSRRRRGS